jgi:GT2 family glycosyltransferase
MRIKLVTADIAEPIPSLALDRRYSGVRVLICANGSPLGELRYSSKDFTDEIPASRVDADIDAHFGWEAWRQTVEARVEPNRMAPASLPAITVAVCTKDRPESLKRCLTALQDMDYPAFEILVVDNASADPAIKGIAVDAGARYVHEPRVGLDRARNTALREASFELVAFCDDDVRVSARWLHGYAQAFRDPRTGVATGLVLPDELETQWQLEFERYGGMAKGFRRFSVDAELLQGADRLNSSRWGVGANMAFRRSVAIDVGLFDIGLDVGTPSGGGGDIEMLFRVVHAGHRLRYESDAWVRHAHRRDRDSLVRQIRANGQSYGCYLQTVTERDPAMANIVGAHRRRWMRGWVLRQVAVNVRRRDLTGLMLAVAELRGARASAEAYRKTRTVAPLISKTADADPDERSTP